MKAASMTARATLRLLQLRLRLWWNSLKHSSWRRRLGYAVAGLAMLGVAVFLAFASWGILRYLRDPRLADTLASSEVPIDLRTLLDQLPIYFSAGAFLAGVFTSFGVLLQSLYLSGDMEFLLAAPLPPRAVFASKLIQAIFPGLVLLGLFSGPALVGLGFSRGYHPIYYLLLPTTLILLVVTGAGLSSVLVMGVVRLISPRRAAEVLGLLGGLAGVICSQTGQFAERIDVGPGQLAALSGRLALLSSAWNPLSWPGRGLGAVGQRDWGSALAFSGLSLVLSAGLLAITLATAEKLYFSGWARVQVGTTARRRRPPRPQRSEAPPVAWLSRILPVPVRALMSKDARLYRRDLRNLSQLVTPILLAVIWTLTLPGAREAAGSTQRARTALQFGSLALALFVGWMFAMRFAMGGLSMEGRRWWLLKAAPLRSTHLLAAKFLVALIPSAGLSLAYLLAVALLQGIPAPTVAYQALAVLVIMSAECSLLLAFGIWTARFDWDNPREISGGASGCLATLAGGAFLALGGGLFIGPPLLAARIGFSPAIGLTLGVISGSLVSATVGLLPLWLAGRRLPRLGEA